MNIDELKNSWKNIELRVSHLEDENRRLARKLRNNAAMSYRSNLSRRYIMAIIACIVAPFSLIGINEQTPLPMLLIVGYIVFFVVMALLMGYTLYRLRTTDYISIPTKAAIVAVTQLEIMRKRHNLIGYALAVPLLSYIFYFLYQVGHRGMIVGAIVGLVVGFIVGVFIDRRTRRIIRHLRDTLASELQEDQ